jgi:low affinity Fe/Cu permease
MALGYRRRQTSHEQDLGVRSTTAFSRFLSSALHRIMDWLSHAVVAPILGSSVLGFVVVLAVVGHPQSWQSAFATVASAITLVMVFVLQHTQSRQQQAVQMKLDEIIRALPAADDRFVHVEVANEEEFVEIDARLAAQHRDLRDT